MKSSDSELGLGDRKDELESWWGENNPASWLGGGEPADQEEEDCRLEVDRAREEDDCCVVEVEWWSRCCCASSRACACLQPGLLLKWAVIRFRRRKDMEQPGQTRLDCWSTEMFPVVLMVAIKQERKGKSQWVVRRRGLKRFHCCGSKHSSGARG